MKSVIERIERGHFWKFHGGIHPPEQKFLTTDKPIRNLALPKLLILPLQQHIGQAGELLVNVGDSVLKGQALTQSVHPMALPIHAPTSGTITAIENAIIAHPSGLSELCLFITPDNKDTWCARTICTDFYQLSSSEIINKIANAGISGMGGAGFPTYMKLNSSSNIEYLIINAAECEPYITADDLLIREHCATIVEGIKILNHLLKPSYILVGIEDNKPEAIKTLQKATNDLDNVKICILPTIYPSGGEKQLIKILTGKEIPSGSFPSEQGILMQNIATCYAIADAVINDKPLIKRVVTVSGQALKKPQNVWALLGTPVNYLLEQCDYQSQGSETKQIIIGGPMMGFTLSTDQVPIIKTSNCILAPSEKEISLKNKEVECIRCGQCADVCPAQLLPQELQWSAKAKDQQQLEKLNLFDCIECGACAYVCPSQIPLVHYYRIAKAEIRQQKQLDLKAEKAKIRFEARKLRLERDKKAREEKHKKAAEERRARMNSGSAASNNEKSAVAAALARVKAKKAQAKITETVNDDDFNQATKNKENQVAAAVNRAKEKAKERNTAVLNEDIHIIPAPTSSTNDTVESDNISSKLSVNTIDHKKAKIAEIVAKAKEKKLNSAKHADTYPIKVDQTNQVNLADPSKSQITEQTVSSVENKKEKVASAVAKAKAKAKAKKINDSVPSSSIEKQIISAQDTKKAKISAAVAKAKTLGESISSTKTMIKTETISQNESDVSLNNIITKPPASSALDKKSRVAAAVAKAKAKKQQRSESI